MDDQPRGSSRSDATWLRQAIAEARARRPAVRIDDDQLAAHLRARKAPLQSLRVDDVLLAWACAAGDRAALAELEESVLAQVPRWVARVDGAAADEVQQLLRERLLVAPGAQLLDYQGRGPLKAFVRVAAVRCAIDLQRQRRPQGDSADLDALLAQPDPEIDFVKLHDREALRGVLLDAVRSLPARDASLLKLHYLEGMSLEKLALLERSARSTVARWLADARKRALERVRQLLRERLRLTAGERSSLLRFLDSRLDLSLRSAFGRSSGAK
jgi:RNA polymerase sigma-70 factor (ECF subfamily)